MACSADPESLEPITNQPGQGGLRVPEPNSSSASKAKESREKEHRLLTVAQVAEMLSLGRSSVYEIIARGELEAFKLGSSIRIRRDAVQSFLERSRL